MPSIQNCTTLPVSIWGRRITDGGVEGREVYLDDVAAGGSAEFSHHGDLVVRKCSKQTEVRGERLVGPVQWDACTLQQLPSGQLRAVDGAHHLCKRKGVPTLVLGLSVAVGALLLVLLVVGVLHLTRNQSVARFPKTRDTVAYSNFY